MAPGILGRETLREASWHDLLAELDRQICVISGVQSKRRPTLHLPLSFSDRSHCPQ